MRQTTLSEAGFDQYRKKTRKKRFLDYMEKIIPCVELAEAIEPFYPKPKGAERRPHPKNLKTAIDVRLIEVKGRAYSGEIALTSHEYKTAQRLANVYWLYVVFHCATPSPLVNILRNPATLDWQPMGTVEYYRLKAYSIRLPVVLREDRVSYPTDSSSDTQDKD